MFRHIADVEGKFTSVERLDHFMKVLKPEGEFETEDKKSIQNWPMDGSIVFDNISVSSLLLNFKLTGWENSFLRIRD